MHGHKLWVAAGLGALGLALSACNPPAAPAEPEVFSADAGESCYRDGNYRCAARNFQNIVKQYPGDSHALAMAAFSLTRAGMHKEALWYYRKGDEAGLSTYDFYAFYAKSLDAVGDVEGAIKRNRQALDIVPSLVDVRGDLARELVKQGKTGEALELLKSFDRSLVAKGQPPYFKTQIAAIEEKAGK